MSLIRLRIAEKSLGGKLWDTFTVFSKYTCYMYVIQCYTFHHLIGAPKFEPNMSLLTQAVSSPDPTFSRRETSDVPSRISFVDSRVTNLVFNYMPCMNGLCAVIWYFTGKALATKQSMLHRIACSAHPQCSNSPSNNIHNPTQYIHSGSESSLNPQVLGSGSCL